MLSLSDLARQLRPGRTSLLLGAGACISSGAPSGAQLAKELGAQMSPPISTDDLEYVCGVWELRSERRALVTAVRSILRDVKPSNALLALPDFQWRAIYSTNFDQLVEKSFRAAEVPLQVIRSNFDFGHHEPGQVCLYKMHGCITQDVAFGDAGRLVLSEHDYDLVGEYREAIFRALSFDLVTGDTVVVGQSLRDAHLRKLAKEAAGLRGTSGTPGRVFVVVYERDEDQALLLEQFGLQVAFGSLEDLLHELASGSGSQLIRTSIGPIGGLLPANLAPSCVDVAHAVTLQPNATRLFNGAPASYADISSGLTVERAVERRILEAQNARAGFFTVVTGTAGVGKTSLARRILHARSTEGFACWEALDSFPIDVDGWLEVEANLRKSGRQGFLLLDDCTRDLRTVNRLVGALGALERPFLRLILTANAGVWRSRYRSPYFFSRGTQIPLGRLTEVDLQRFVDLVDTEPRIKGLVEPSFREMGRAQKLTRLRDRCSSEMYVCLKHVFGSSELDYILLQEYSELGESEREIYRHVAALQAMGARVHRQLVMRATGLEAGQLNSMLTLLEGIVEEYEVKKEDGLYKWSVRHDVIAETIAKWKYSDPDDQYDLLDRVISGLNPTVFMELETARSICATEWGIPRLTNPQDQRALLEKLITMLPAERIPRRRLIKSYLDTRELSEVAQAIKAARAALRTDTIVDRYEVLMLLYRAVEDDRLLPEDRAAILRDAVNKGQRLSKGTPEKHNIRAYADTAVALGERTGSFEALEDAVALLRTAENELLDPDLGKWARHYERLLSRAEATDNALIGAAEPGIVEESAIDSVEE